MICAVFRVHSHSTLTLHGSSIASAVDPGYTWAKTFSPHSWWTAGSFGRLKRLQLMRASVRCFRGSKIIRLFAAMRRSVFFLNPHTLDTFDMRSWISRASQSSVRLFYVLYDAAEFSQQFYGERIPKVKNSKVRFSRLFQSYQIWKTGKWTENGEFEYIIWCLNFLAAHWWENVPHRD